MMKLKLMRETSTVPFYATDGAAAFDLMADIPEPIVLSHGEIRAVPTGIAIALPAGHAGHVLPRSGSAKRGIGVANAPGLIDEDYTGEVKVLVHNVSGMPLSINPTDRIAQLEIVKVERVEFEVVDKLDKTARGDGGFGSTGV